MRGASDDGNELYLPTPHGDPFYAQPDPIPCIPPGTFLDSREIPFTPAPAVGMPNYPAWHLKFRSTDSFTAPPLPVLREPYGSAGSACHPSYYYAGNSEHPGHGQFGGLLLTALEAGWAVANAGSVFIPTPTTRTCN